MCTRLSVEMLVPGELQPSALEADASKAFPTWLCVTWPEIVRLRLWGTCCQKTRVLDFWCGVQGLGV